MNHYVLISVEKPSPAEDPEGHLWSNFVSQTTGIESKTGGGQRLSEGQWLLDRNGGVAAFAKIVSVAQAQRLKWQVWYLSDSH